MKRRESNQYDMGTAVAAMLDKYSSVWSANGLAVTKRGLLNSALERVAIARRAQQDNSSGGERKWKVQSKKKLAGLAAVASSGVRAYAMDTKNYNAAGEFKRGMSGIYKMNDTECLVLCKLLREFVNSNLTALADYNIDGSLLGQLDGALATFKSLQHAPAKAEGKLELATKEVKAGLQDMLKVLRWWDLFIGAIRLSQRELFDAYRWSRKTHKTGIRHISVRGVVKAEGTGTPLFKVKVSVVESPHKGKTGKSGKFAVYSLQPGEFTLVFERWGYETVRVQSVPAQMGKIKEMVVEMRQVEISQLVN
jgi:hypothetical protein